MTTSSAIYLDYNATAPLRPEAREAMLRVLDRGGNASSIHRFGRYARLEIEEAREVVARAVGGAGEEIIFTSGGTEANALALKGYRACEAGQYLVSATAHDSAIKNAGEGVQGLPVHPSVLPVHPSGLLDLAALEDALSRAGKMPFVSLEWVNSETGVIQPVEEIILLVRRYGGIVHVDAVQALGRIPLDGLQGDARPDLLTLSAHKIGGAQGVGALIVRDGFARRKDIPFAPLLGGGGQEKGRRSGTENVAGIASFGAALSVAVQELTNGTVAQWRILQQEFETKILRVEGARIIGTDSPRVANTTCLAHPALKADIALMKLDMAGMAISSGSACSSGKVGESRTLAAMGMDDALRRSAVRVSFGWNTKPSDLTACAQSWTEAVFSAIG